MKPLHPAIWMALSSALLFGASTPVAKFLLLEINPILLAGLLYLGSGIGLEAYLALRSHSSKKEVHEPHLTRLDIPWLGGAIFFGGVLAPLLLMVGLQKVAASSASLLLNLETVLTALIAWFVFRENVDRRVALGMFAIVLGGAILSTASTSSSTPTLGLQLSVPCLLIVGACLCWAIDNNLTNKISNADPLHIAGLKGLVAGVTNSCFAIISGATLPPLIVVLGAALVGLAGYGLSLSLFIRALRDLGTARTSAYFSISPFIGAALSIVLLHEQFSPQIFFSGLLMAFGVWLHITEKHMHEHVHEVLEHEHMHVHDLHHEHEHDGSVEITEPHSHLHRHEHMVHSHPHYPDMHHRHH